MKLLTSPIFLRMLVAFFAGAFAFLLGRMLFRWLRRGLLEETSVPLEIVSESSLPLHTYHAVIQQLKQQKYELQNLQQAERRRSKTTENISAVVLSNLSSGVMFFAANGLIRQANAAARKILGFSSPLGMNAAEIFRSAESIAQAQPAQKVSDIVEQSLREKTLHRQFCASYLSPNGEERVLDVTLTAVHAPSGEVLGTACLFNDQTEIANIRRQQELYGEMSSEMALELRTSLTTISGYAQQLAVTRDAELARQLAADIAAEAAQLDHTIGGFLAAGKATRLAAHA